MADTKTEWILRIAVFGTFLGHGLLALGVKQGWIKYFEAVGISSAGAMTLLPLIGAMDITVAFIVLFRPIRAVLMWAALWAFITALIRPVSGESILDFVERFANFGAPLALLYLRGLPRKAKNYFS